MVFSSKSIAAILPCSHLPPPIFCHSYLGIYLSYNSYLHKISILQNKAVKIITGTKWDISANPSYTNLKVLNLHELYQFEVAKIMHTLYHKEHPTKLTKFFTKSCVRHTRLTCSSMSLMFTVPLMKSTKLQQSFLYQGVKTWNSIPHNMPTFSFSAFKTNCKNYLLSNDK